MYVNCFKCNVIRYNVKGEKGSVLEWQKSDLLSMSAFIKRNQ